ncbi:MAG: transcriptional repressor LexA [Myxococcales bacterium]|nr:transcriptional repressor LexA [Myxococcales bacterium]
MARLIARKSKSDLTARQSNILDFLVEHISSKGYPPSMREIGKFFSIKSTNGVSDHLRALERKGYINRSAQKGRGVQIIKTSDGTPTKRLELTASAQGAAAAEAISTGPTSASAAAVAQAIPHAANTVDIPVLGKVAAGKPILAVELSEERVSFDQALLPRGGAETFALRIQGRSMVDAGILPEDLVFVHSQPHADNGAIVVALVDGEATVKRYYDEGDRVRLQPENSDMAPIFVEKDASLRLLGKVVGVWRRLG